MRDGGKWGRVCDSLAASGGRCATAWVQAHGVVHKVVGCAQGWTVAAGEVGQQPAAKQRQYPHPPPLARTRPPACSPPAHPGALRSSPARSRRSRGPCSLARRRDWPAPSSSGRPQSSTLTRRPWWVPSRSRQSWGALRGQMVQAIGKRAVFGWGRAAPQSGAPLLFSHHSRALVRSHASLPLTLITSIYSPAGP